MMMSLLHTAELRRQNPVAYLTAVLRNEKAVAMNPADWLPWTYLATLERMAEEQAASSTGTRSAWSPAKSR